MTALAALRARIRQYETQNRSVSVLLPFGVAAFDDHLPGKGIALGAFHEVFGSIHSSFYDAAATLFIAGILARVEGPVVWCLRQRDLFAPALAQAGLAMDRVIFVEAGDEQTLLACFEESMRHPGVSGVVGEVSRLGMNVSRRLQLAAESSGAIGIALWRRQKQNAGSIEQNTVARTRWRVTSVPSHMLPVAGLGRARWQVELLRSQGGTPFSLIMEACDEAGYLAVPANLADRPVATQVGQECATA